MKVALCCIGRLENQYAREFVEHYKKLKFDKIFIYDNNHDGEEHFEDVLQDLIDDGLVEIIDCRNKEKYQLTAYNDCYQKHKDEYEWFAFFGFDEFLFLVNDDNIESYLKKFDGYDAVKINWMIFTDNNLIENDKRPVLERFTTPMQYDKCIIYTFPMNNHVKTIVRGGLNIRWNSTPHTPGKNLKYSNSIGKPSNDSPFEPYVYNEAYIKHFTTKTIDEFLNGKFKKGVADRTYDSFRNSYDINNFFSINEKNTEKENYLIQYYKHK